jgi:ubiquinone biosynthesis protein Coq4
MGDTQLEVMLKIAQTIHPQIETNRHFEIDWEKLRQLPAGTLGREVARCLDEHGFEPIASGDWIQGDHDV